MRAIQPITSHFYHIDLCSLLDQAFIIEDEEQTRSLPPNPFNELSEKVLEEYKSMVERKQHGQEGTHPLYYCSLYKTCVISLFSRQLIVSAKVPFFLPGGNVNKNEEFSP